MKTIEKLVIVILALAILGILFFFLSDIKDFSSERARLEKCKGSVKTQVLTVGAPVSNPETIECPAKEITVETEKEIVDEMVECWEIYNQGKLFKGRGSFCGICSFINVDEDIKFNVGDFMKNSYYKGETYEEYLNADVESSNVELSSIENYAVVFIQSKERKEIPLILAIAQGVVYASPIPIIFPAKYNEFSQVLLIPYNKDLECTYLVK